VLPVAIFFAVRLALPEPGDYRQPQLAASGKLVAVTFGAENAIYYSSSHDGGRSFSKPSKIAELPGLLLGRHRGPRIAITKDAIVISAISKLEGDVVVWRSTDNGRTWSRGAFANQAHRSAIEGLHAMIALPDGELYAVWLDTPGKGKRLMGARSDDDGVTWSKNILIYESPGGKICECCHPSLAAAPDGQLHAMWRNSLDGDRDMFTAVSHDGGRSFEVAAKVGAGTWHLEACPMDGGGIAVAPDGKLVATFRRQLDVFLDIGNQPETLLDSGKDPAIAVNDHGVFVVWTGRDGVMAKVPGSAKPVLLDHDGGFPQIIALPDGAVLAAYERKGEIEFQRLTAGQTQF
jgi:hypothetical protein